MEWNDSRLTGWLEAIPNVSEGRNKRHIALFGKVMAEVDGVHLLHTDANADAHRTVYTLVGPADAVRKALVALYVSVSENLCMETHRGEHPRQGLVDVCPLVPLGSTPLSVAIEAGKKLAFELGFLLGQSGWFYEYNATQPHRKSLASLRKGEYEALPRKALLPEWAPDFGNFDKSSTLGMTVIGARPLLVAYNIALSGLNVVQAQRIAKKVRASNGGLPGLRSIGWWMEGYGCAQVSCNIVDIQQTTAKQAFDAVAFEAQQAGGSVIGSELIGLMPLSSLRDFPNVESAVAYLQLTKIHSFDPKERILEWSLDRLASVLPAEE